MQVGLGKYQQEMVTSIENKKAFQYAAKFYRAMGLAPVTTTLDAIEWSKMFSSTPIRNALRQLTKDQATAMEADIDALIKVSRAMGGKATKLVLSPDSIKMFSELGGVMQLAMLYKSVLDIDRQLQRKDFSARKSRQPGDSFGLVGFCSMVHGECSHITAECRKSFQETTNAFVLTSMEETNRIVWLKKLEIFGA